MDVEKPAGGELLVDVLLDQASVKMKHIMSLTSELLVGETTTFGNVFLDQ